MTGLGWRTFVLFYLAVLIFATDHAFALKLTCPHHLATRGYMGVVDGYGSGSHLHEVLRERGYIPVSILSTKRPLTCYAHTYCRANYDLEFSAVSPLDRLLADLSRLPLVSSIAASEPAVPLNDSITQALGLPTNGVAMSAARRHKELAQKVLRDAQLNSIREILTGSIEKALEWIEDKTDGLSGEYPVVVKPNSSAGGEGFTLCRSRAEVVAAFRDLVGKRNKYGTLMTEVLVQEYLAPADYQGIPGGEYVINPVSKNGRHIVVDGWRYNKVIRKRKGGATSLVYDWDELLDIADEKYSLLIDYALQVIDVFGMKFGPSHLEIMVTARGPVLIEMGARLMGGSMHRALRSAIGYSSLDLTVDVYDPHSNRFEELAALGRTPFRRKKHVAVFQFLAPESGYLIDSPLHAELEKLKQSTLTEYRIHTKTWDWIDASFDLASSPGTALLESDSAEAIQNDIRRLRELEAQGLFSVKRKLPWRVRMVPKRYRRKLFPTSDPFYLKASETSDVTFK